MIFMPAHTPWSRHCSAPPRYAWIHPVAALCIGIGSHDVKHNFHQLSLFSLLLLLPIWLLYRLDGSEYNYL